jgi:hypothetical protein
VARIAVALLLVVGVASVAKAVDVDWKMYGTATVEDQQHICFYDANGIVRQADGRIRVWTKCLLQTELNSVSSQGELGAKVTENAARKMLDHSFPVIALIEDMTFDQAVTIMMYEEAADIGNLSAVAKFLYELDCLERKDRRLSTQVRIQGKDVFEKKVSDWEYTAPETNGARLLKMLCR